MALSDDLKTRDHTLLAEDSDANDYKLPRTKFAPFPRIYSATVAYRCSSGCGRLQQCSAAHTTPYRTN